MVVPAAQFGNVDPAQGFLDHEVRALEIKVREALRRPLK